MGGPPRDQASHEADDGMQKIYVETRFSAPPCEGSPALKKY